MFRLLVLCGTVASCLALEKFTFTDCTTSANPLISVNSLIVSTDPIHFPGNNTGSAEINLLQDIIGMDLELNVQVQKKIFLGYVDVPCISGVGSCTYKVCDLLSGLTWPNNPNHCPVEIYESSPNTRCFCPFTKGLYQVNTTTAYIPEPSGVWKFAAQGEYRAKLTVTNTATNDEVGCYMFTGSTESDCVGFDCLFGKK